MADRFIRVENDEFFYIADASKLSRNLEWFEEYYKEDYPEDYEQVAKEEYFEYLYENSMSGSEVEGTMNDLHDKVIRYESTILDSLHTERTELGRMVLKQLVEKLDIKE
jgi:hypothetical protein